MKTGKNSVSVQAVIDALAAQIAISNRSVPTVLLASFHALRATMAMTAAPTP
jgi:hypothetical protein